MKTAFASAEMVLYAVYEKPSDYPHSFVCRRFLIAPGAVKADSLPTLVSGDLEWLRGYLRNMGLYRLERHIDDDPVILETWI